MDLKQTLEKMLSANRFFNSKTTDGADGRNPFENDYSRIVLSSYVRRMQDKAQVFPLAQNDFVRTRLTHSLEVSQITRSLCRMLGLDGDLGEALALAQSRLKDR